MSAAGAMVGSQVVGREPERARIDTWLQSPTPTSLLIDGEAGIGKSTWLDHRLAVRTPIGLLTARAGKY